jgi:hypothetical protein
VTDPTTLQKAMRAVEDAVQEPFVTNTPRPGEPPGARWFFDKLTDEASPSPFTNGSPNTDPFGPLKRVLDEAFQQSASGKGAERHGRGVPFDRQPILEIQRMVGPGFALGQCMKKASEAAGMVSRGDREAACRELLGTIVYAAAAIVAIRELP